MIFKKTALRDNNPLKACELNIYRTSLTNSVIFLRKYEEKVYFCAH